MQVAFHIILLHKGLLRLHDLCIIANAFVLGDLLRFRRLLDKGLFELVFCDEGHKLLEI